MDGEQNSTSTVEATVVADAGTPTETVAAPASEASVAASPTENQTPEEAMRAQIAAALPSIEEGDDSEEDAADETAAAFAAAGEEEAKDEVDEAEATDTEEDVDAEPFELEPSDALTAKGLAEVLRKDKALDAALAANPDLKNTLFAAVRRAGKVAEYEQHFASPAEAATAADTANRYMDISTAIMGAKDVESANAALQAMVAATALLDDDGNPVKDPATGTIQTDGSVGRFAHNIMGLGLAMFSEAAAKKGDQSLVAAYDLIKESLGFAQPSSANEDDLSDEQRQRQEDIERRDREVSERETVQRQQEVERYEKGIDDGISTKVGSAIDALISKPALGDFDRNKAKSEIENELYKLISHNKTYERRLDLLTRKPQNAKTAQERVALAVEYVDLYLGKVARPILVAAGAKLTQKQQESTQRQAARVDAARSETNMTSRTKGIPNLSPSQQYDAVASKLRETLGRDASPEEIMRAQLQAATTR